MRSERAEREAGQRMALNRCVYPHSFILAFAVRIGATVISHWFDPTTDHLQGLEKVAKGDVKCDRSGKSGEQKEM